jgi:site-specific recombinase XerD
LPSLVFRADARTQRRFLEFFTATIRNKNTREAYARAVASFLDWCESRGVLELAGVEPMTVAGYVEDLGTAYSRPTVKQHLAAVRMCFDWLVSGQVLPSNPAWSVRGPRHVVKRGKTPVLTAAESRALLDSIDPSTVAGLRDRALIAVMVFSFARVGAAVGMDVEDYYAEAERRWLRLHEKGGKRHEVPAHHSAAAYLDSYLEAAGLESQKKTPLFRTIRSPGGLSSSRLTRNDALRMVKRRARAAGLSDRVCNHSFRATGITTYLENGGTIERAQAMAAHESPRTTKLYDRTSDRISLDEVERILI